MPAPRSAGSSQFRLLGEELQIARWPDPGICGDAFVDAQPSGRIHRPNLRSSKKQLHLVGKCANQMCLQPAACAGRPLRSSRVLGKQLPAASRISARAKFPSRFSGDQLRGALVDMGTRVGSGPAVSFHSTNSRRLGNRGDAHPKMLQPPATRAPWHTDAAGKPTAKLSCGSRLPRPPNGETHCWRAGGDGVPPGRTQIRAPSLQHFQARTHTLHGSRYALPCRLPLT